MGDCGYFTVGKSHICEIAMEHGICCGVVNEGTNGVRVKINGTDTYDWDCPIYDQYCTQFANCCSMSKWNDPIDTSNTCDDSNSGTNFSSARLYSLLAAFVPIAMLLLSVF